ncbi:MAG: hypothetical protein JNL74_14835, partial [Fibrobacteres bacterium]|nr:hypothetical protein [Fibrobacterota bacterium]
MNTKQNITKQLFENIVDKRQFFLMHDQQGNIVEVLAYPEFNPLPMFAEIVKKGRLTPFFDMSYIDRDEDNGRITLPGIGKKYPFYFSTYYSNFPLHNLVTKKIDNNLYLARIAISEFVPTAQLQNGLGILFADYLEDTLEAFEPNAFALLQQSGTKPESILGQPLSRFLSPTPLEFQTLNISPFTLQEIKKYQKLLEINCLSTPPDSVLISDSKSVTFSRGEGWIVNSSINRPVFIRMPVIVNTFENDVVFSVTMKQRKGSGSFLAIGKETKSETTPDENGYMVGD